MKNKSQKPLFTIGKRVKAKVYKARFRPFQATRYLNIVALKKAKKAVIEIGSIEAVGRSATLAAEIRNGAIVDISPVPCRNCAKEKAQVKAHRAELKKVAIEAMKRVREKGLPVVQLPIPITRVQSFYLGSELIFIFLDGIFDICFPKYYPDGWFCLDCITGPSVCVKPA